LAFAGSRKDYWSWGGDGEGESYVGEGVEDQIGDEHDVGRGVLISCQYYVRKR